MKNDITSPRTISLLFHCGPLDCEMMFTGCMARQRLAAKQLLVSQSQMPYGGDRYFHKPEECLNCKKGKEIRSHLDQIDPFKDFRPQNQCDAQRKVKGKCCIPGCSNGGLFIHYNLCRLHYNQHKADTLFKKFNTGHLSAKKMLPVIEGFKRSNQSIETYKAGEGMLR